MRINESDFIDVMMPDGIWAIGICVHSMPKSFDVLCLDGNTRKMDYAGECIKWRIAE